MRARIHRGAREIGGSCVEVESEGVRLVLDLGRPLTASSDDEAVLPPVAGLGGGDPTLVGVVVSHPHEDHYGLVRQLPAAVPVFLGEAAARILREAAFFTGGGLTVEPAGFVVNHQAFDVGPFRVTPYLVDHSAFDSYALLVEADGRRLFYTGDLRAHGRKGQLFERLVDWPPRADAVLMEGTNVRVGDPAAPPPSEEAVEEACVATCRATRGLVLAAYSGQNIDRLVTLYRAALKANRSLVLDLYGAAVAAATEHASIPHVAPDWDRVLVYVPQKQRVRVKESGQFHRVDSLGRRRLFPEDLGPRAGSLVLTFRYSMMRELEAARCLEGACCIYSQWPGYLDEPSGQRLREWLAAHGIELALHHASGHATPADLARLVAAFSPARIVPIHTAAAEHFPALFPRVEPHADDEWWEV
jgi:ribonuclease J